MIIVYKHTHNTWSFEVLANVLIRAVKHSFYFMFWLLINKFHAFVWGNHDKSIFSGNIISGIPCKCRRNCWLKTRQRQMIFAKTNISKENPPLLLVRMKLEATQL